MPWVGGFEAPLPTAAGSSHAAPLGPRGERPGPASRTEGYKSSRRSSQVSTGHLEAPPNTSTLLSTQGMMLPGMFVEQLAILMISCARRTRSQMLNWLSSPTNACVASNLPPTVSWGRGTEHVGAGSGQTCLSPLPGV